jgi:hypothetical protein
MLSHTIRSVHVAQHRVDFRKRLAGLLAEAYAMELDPHAGECVVFIHPSRRVVRVLGGDDYGAWLVERFFEQGKLEQKFRFMLDPCFVDITYAELEMLLDGTAYCVEKRAKKWRR